MEGTKWRSTAVTNKQLFLKRLLDNLSRKGVNRCSTVLDDDVDDFTQYSTLVLRQFISIFLFVLAGKVSVEGNHAFVNDISFSMQILCVDILRSVFQAKLPWLVKGRIPRALAPPWECITWCGRLLHVF